MNTDTGAIAQFETEQDAADAGHDLMLTKDQAVSLLQMSRSERRAWAKKVMSNRALFARTGEPG